MAAFHEGDLDAANAQIYGDEPEVRAAAGPVNFAVALRAAWWVNGGLLAVAFTMATIAATTSVARATEDAPPATAEADAVS